MDEAPREIDDRDGLEIDRDDALREGIRLAELVRPIEPELRDAPELRETPELTFPPPAPTRRWAFTSGVGVSSPAMAKAIPMRASGFMFDVPSSGFALPCASSEFTALVLPAPGASSGALQTARAWPP